MAPRAPGDHGLKVVKMRGKEQGQLAALGAAGDAESIVHLACTISSPLSTVLDLDGCPFRSALLALQEPHHLPSDRAMVHLHGKNGFRQNAEQQEQRLMDRSLSDVSKILYLEVIDATFSIDGVLGAFAFTLAIPLIIVGNGSAPLSSEN
jgi:hypothetical protein